MGEIRSVNEFEDARREYLKQVDQVGAHEHVTFSWEPPLPFQFKLLLKLFCLVPYMLRKCDQLNSYIDDFNKTFAIYHILFDGGWAKWVDDVFSASTGQWTMKIE